MANYCVSQSHIHIDGSLCRGTGCSTHCSGDWQKAVVADEDDVEDRGRAKQVVHDQPQFTQSSAQCPPACEDVGDVDRDAECSYRNSYWEKI